MKTYLLLVKIFFKEGFSFKKIIGSGNLRSKTKTILLIVALVYAAGAFLTTFGIMFFKLAEALSQLGMIEVMLLYLFMYGTFLSIIFVLFRANGYLFNYKDYQLLEPLPIPSRIVTYAKATVMMVLILMSLFLFTAPITFAYFYFAKFNFFSLILYLIGLLTLPIIPTIIFSLIAMFIAKFTARFKRSNIFTIILTFIVVFALMIFSFQLNTMSNVNPLLNQQEFVERLSKYYPTMQWFMNSVNNRTFVDIVLMIGVNGGLLFVFLTAIQKFVLKTNQKGITHRPSKRIKAIVSKKQSVFASIIKKEFNKLTNTTSYAINSGFGVIIMLIGGIAALIFSDKINDFLVNITGLGFPSELILLILIAFCLSTVFTSAITLSLEGKNFWIMKSLPIKPETVVFAKLMFNVILALPIAILSMSMIAFAINTKILTWLVMVVFISSFSLVTSAMGSVINLIWPKFDFVDPIEVVKQSAGALLGLFGSMLIALLDGLIVYFLFDIISWEISILLGTFLNLIIFGLLGYYIKRNTESLFIKMNA